MIEIRRSDLTKIVVGIDPAVTSGENSDETGMIVVGRGPCQPDTCKLVEQHLMCPGHGYVLADLSGRMPPREWATLAVQAHHQWQGDRIVGEVNNGGDMIGDAIHAVDASVPYRKVTATRGKKTRAEPASALYDQGRVHHLGAFPKLEDQLTTWTLDAKWSPDRLDALVWALAELGLIGAQGAAFLQVWNDEIENRQPAAAPELRGMPTFGDTEHPLKPGCAHRWRLLGDVTYCVVCGGHQVAAHPDPVSTT